MKLREILEPSSCRWCGVGHYCHAQQWVELVGWHVYAPPQQWQIKIRMRARQELPTSVWSRWRTW